MEHSGKPPVAEDGFRVTKGRFRDIGSIIIII